MPDLFSSIVLWTIGVVVAAVMLFTTLRWRRKVENRRADWLSANAQQRFNAWTAVGLSLLIAVKGTIMAFLAVVGYPVAWAFVVTATAGLICLVVWAVTTLDVTPQELTAAGPEFEVDVDPEVDPAVVFLLAKRQARMRQWAAVLGLLAPACIGASLVLYDAPWPVVTAVLRLFAIGGVIFAPMLWMRSDPAYARLGRQPIGI